MHTHDSPRARGNCSSGSRTCAQLERARKNAEAEAAEANSRLNELQLAVQSLTNDKRKLEADLSALQAELDDALGTKQACSSWSVRPH